MILPQSGRGFSSLFPIPHSEFRISLCLCVSVVFFTGCQTGAKVASPIRGIWVTRFDYKTKDDVVRIMDNCKGAGFNTVMFQVRGNGTAFYRSSLEPWAEELGGRDPGFDPLAEACQAAHQRGMKLHAWVNVMPGWRGTAPPKNPHQLYHARPAWFWYDQKGARQPLTAFYVSLNPCLPEVRKYLVDVVGDLVRRYPVDGLHMDYIRFPNEPPAIPFGSGIDYPRDAKTLALYKRETGLWPQADAAKWSAWRTQQVSRLVAQIGAMMRKTRPEAMLTAAVGPVREKALTHFQDARRWMADGSIDGVVVMNYTADLGTFVSRNQPWLSAASGKLVVPGLSYDEKQPVAENSSVVRQEIEAAVEATGQFCLFAYSYLFDSKADPPEEARKRAQRRRELVPFVKMLAGR